MHRPLSTNPLLCLLARRAYAAAMPRLGPGVSADPWCGLGVLAGRVIGEGAERTPATWASRWPAAAREGLAAARRHSSWSDLSERTAPPMEALVVQAHETRRQPTPWGQWKATGPVLFGVEPASGGVAPVVGLPDDVRTVGVVACPVPAGFDEGVLECLERSKAQGKETWVEVPADPVAWRQWGAVHWELCHRLGVSVWFQAPNQEGWAGYAAFLETAMAGWVRHPRWEQWVWPAADLLQQGMEDTMVYGKPGHREAAPWPWEGRCKNPDWLRLRKHLWASAESALGGDGALEEIAMASILADAGLLVSSSGQGLA